MIDAPLSRTPLADALEVKRGFELAAERETSRQIAHAMKWPPFDEVAADMVVLALQEGISEGKLDSIGGLPARRVIRYWRESNPDFNAACEAAQEDAADAIVSEMDVIADDQARDPRCRKLSIDHRKWKVEHLSKRYRDAKGGDSLSITQTNINVEGDAQIAPADAYLRLLNGG